MVDVGKLIISFIAFIFLVFYFFSSIIASFTLNMDGIGVFSDNLIFSV